MSAPPTATWRPSGQPLRVPKATGNRVPWQLIGTLAWCGERVWLEYRWVSGKMNGAQVVDFLDTLAEQTTPDCPTVVVLDNASFHTCAAVRARWEDWARRGLWLLYLPAYGAHFNLVERVWLELKHRLLPRRWYRDAGALRSDVERQLQRLGGREI